LRYRRLGIKQSHQFHGSREELLFAALEVANRGRLRPPSIDLILQ